MFYNMVKEYEAAKVAIDPVIFTISNGRLKVLLHTREKEPFKNLKELPGGLLLPGETAEETLNRKLKELVGCSGIFFKQFGTFTEPSRDPRDRTISIGFVALINEEKIKNVVSWYDLESVEKFAFDHKKIVQAGRRYLKENIDVSIVRHFLPELFPLNKLQEIYEILEEKKYDNRNFRKKMIYSGNIEEANQIERNVSHRPAKLFKFK